MPASILLINEVSWIGGAEGAMLDLISALDSRYYRVSVVLPEEGELPDVLRSRAICVDIVPFYGLKARNPLRYFETIARLVRLVHRHQVDLIHVNQHYFANYGVALGRVCRKPVLVHLRGVETDEFYAQYARHLTAANGVVCVSEAARARLMEYATNQMPRRQAKALSNRTVTVYDGFRPSDNAVSGSELRKRYAIAPQVHVVGIVGQVTPEKGLGEFVEAAQVVLHAHPDVHFLVVGADPDAARGFGDQLKHTLNERGLGASFTFTGFVRDSAALISGMDVSVLASHQDAFPRVVLETLSAGVPMVATRVGGVPEMVEDGVSGLLVPARNPAELAKAILRALEMPRGDRERLIAAGKESVSCFSVERHAEQIQKQYVQLMRGRA